MELLFLIVIYLLAGAFRDGIREMRQVPQEDEFEIVDTDDYGDNVINFQEHKRGIRDVTRNVH